MNEDGRARLRDAAASRVGKEAKEEISRDERSERRDDDSSPAHSAGRIHVRSEATRQQDERDDDESDERTDDEAERQRELVLTPPEIFDETDDLRVPWRARRLAGGPDGRFTRRQRVRSHKGSSHVRHGIAP